VQAVLDDWRTAPIDERLRATLGFLDKLTLNPDAITADDARLLREAGLSEAAIEDAIHVCTLFNVYDRLADSFEFDIPDEKGFAASASSLLKRGYMM
jgi:alkylhydroperoxidase family enzyme